jgi:hypothetical protein
MQVYEGRICPAAGNGELTFPQACAVKIYNQEKAGDLQQVYKAVEQELQVISMMADNNQESPYVVKAWPDLAVNSEHDGSDHYALPMELCSMDLSQALQGQVSRAGDATH